MKVTTIAPANIAFIKYWGRSSLKDFLPANNNISMTMSGCSTIATIEVLPEGQSDSLEIKYEKQNYHFHDTTSQKAQELVNQISRIRNLAHSKAGVRIKSSNNFPADAGIASSASSFAAITAALLLVFGLEDKFKDKAELSRQIRLSGSASAARSALGGFVELLPGKTNKESYCIQIAPEDHWDLVDLVAVVSLEKKKFPSSQGHELADTSPFYQTRLKEMQARIDLTRAAILKKDFKTLGECIEAEMFSMHTVMMTQKPSLLYWAPGTVAVLQEISKLRDEKGILAYCTIDAGANVHVICQKKDYSKVEACLRGIPAVKWVIFNEPCAGVREIDEHLF